MKVIEFSEIINYFQEHKIAYSLYNEHLVQKSYTIASLFSPIDNGFYFFIGSQFQLPVNNSLILAEIPSDSNNTFLIVENKDIQLLFYRLLNKLFSPYSNGVINTLSQIHEEATIGNNVQIDAFTVIGKCKIGNNVIIGSNCKLYDYSEIGDNTIIESGSVIGTRGIAWTWDESQTKKVLQPQLGGVKVAHDCLLSANTIIVRGSLNEKTTIDAYSFLAPGCRLGHGTQIGKYVHFANAVVTGGNTKIGDYCFVGSASVFRPKVKIDDNTVVGAGSVVVKNTTQPGKTLMGVPAKEFDTKENLSGMPKPKKYDK